MFKDAKNAAANAGSWAETAANASQAANAYADSLQAGIAEGSYDPNDPGFAPIEGVDLDAYAKAVSAVTKAGAQTENDAAKAAETEGVHRVGETRAQPRELVEQQQHTEECEHARGRQRDRARVALHPGQGRGEPAEQQADGEERQAEPERVGRQQHCRAQEIA